MFRFILTAFLYLSFSSPTLAQAFRVGLVLDKGGKDDKSFNSAAYQGAMKAKKELGIDLKYVEATDTNAIESLQRAFAHKGFDLVISIGFAQMEGLKKVAPQFPQTKFAIVDGNVQAPNVRALLFEEQEGSFVVGALAEMKSKSPTVGFIGGMEIPLIRRFEMGYEAGVKYINPKAKVIANYVGVSGEAWNNPTKAKELALSQYASGVDVIFVAAGASGTGVFDAAEDQKKLAIGVDSNQDSIKPGFILTSMIKGVDVAVYDTIKQAQAGHFTGGVMHYGLKEHGVDYTLDKDNQALITPEMKNRADSIEQQIIAGKIQVPDYYKKK